jgi:group I intron endonuclease
VIGIYLITCSATGGRYVGASLDIEERWRQHRGMLRAGEHHAARLQAAYDEHGLASLVFSVIEELAEPVLLPLREAEWIKALGPEFNVTKVELAAMYRAAKLANPVRFWLGKRRPDVGAQVAAKLSGRKLSEETRAKMRGPRGPQKNPRKR